MAGQDVRIAGYDELRPIGKGGFGVVYQARDGRFARDVAIKVLNGVLNDTMTARFERECHAVGALSGHPHIVVVHASGTTDDGVLFLVMELLPGGSLADRLAGAGPQSWPMAVELGVQLGGALETAHRGGVLHRDVKPENVLLSAYRHPKLVDFGIATVLGGFETKSSSISASLAHAAPEILAGKRASAASDVYALGSTLFQVLTGHPAFHHEDDETLYPMLTRISSAPVPDLRPHGVPDGVAAVLERAMAKQPEDRYDTALAFAIALQQAAAVAGQVVSGPVVIGHEHPQAAMTTAAETTFIGSVTPALADPEPVVVTASPRRPRRGAQLATATVVTVALALGAAVWLTREDSPAPKTTVAAQNSVYRFAQAADSTIRATRTWTLSASGRVLSNDTLLVNTSASVMRRVAVEIIPKSVAEDVNDIDFATQGSVIVETDPVVRYTLTLAPGREVHLRWSVRLPEPIDVTRLKRLAKDQRDAEMAAATTRASIARTVGLGAAALIPFPNTSAADPGVAQVLPVAPVSPPAKAILPQLPDSGGSTGTDPVPPEVVQPDPDPQTTTAPPAPPPVVKPGKPQGVTSRNPIVVGRDSNGLPTTLDVTISWSAPSTGDTPTAYCVRWSKFSYANRAGPISTPDCRTGSSRTLRLPRVDGTATWVNWEVLARNKGGDGDWERARPIVPDLVGKGEGDGAVQLRAVGQTVQYLETKTTDSSLYYKIFDQSPRSGVRTGGALVKLYYYVPA